MLLLLSELQKTFDENLKKRFANAYKVCNHAINKFMLLLREGVHPFKYMDNWKKFSETSLLKKERSLQTPKFGRY